MPPRCLGTIDPAASRASLDADEIHHLTRVLRLKPGAIVQVFDGRGHAWRGRLETAPPRSIHVALDAPVVTPPEPPVRVTMAVGLLKGEAMDTVVRDATMLGVAAIVPVLSAHVVVPARARTEAAVARWRRVAIASCKQCGRAVVPEISSPVDFASVCARASGEMLMLCTEPTAGAGEPGSAHVPVPPSSDAAKPRATVLIGPEGGWSEDEIHAAKESGAVVLRFGPRTLRAEVAPTVALAALWTMWGWTTEPPTSAFRPPTSF